MVQPEAPPPAAWLGWGQQVGVRGRTCPLGSPAWGKHPTAQSAPQPWAQAEVHLLPWGVLTSSATSALSSERPALLPRITSFLGHLWGWESEEEIHGVRLGVPGVQV